MRYLTVITLSVLLLGLAGCPMDLDTQRYPTSQPSASDLPGIYRPAAETIELNTKVGNYASSDFSIELRADGTFEFHRIPDWWRTDFGKPTGGFDDGSGQWKVARHQNWWGIELHFRDQKAFAAPSDGGFTTEANLIGQKAPYDISLTIGDPDQGREMRFAKVPLASPTGT